MEGERKKPKVGNKIVNKKFFQKEIDTEKNNKMTNRTEIQNKCKGLAR
jgi:hypothetical protein